MPLTAAASHPRPSTTGGYHKVRAPRCHGAAVAEPRVGDAQELITANRDSRQSWSGGISDEPIADLIQEARQHLMDAANAYTARYRDTRFAEVSAGSPLVLSGHQPELFHAGVWFKNFVLDRISGESGGLGIHVLIDNDLLRRRSLSVPVGSSERAGSDRLSFDDHAPAVPHEEAFVENWDKFQTFANRASQAVENFVDDPTIQAIWPQVLRSTQRGGNIGAALSEARHLLERDWGLNTLEVPLSAICQSRVFRVFAGGILERLPEFHAIYNESLVAYRKEHRLRSRSHPAPALKTDESEWLEAPFWIWDRESPQRDPLFVRVRRGEVRLRRGTHESEIAAWNPSKGEAALQLAALESAGIKIRPRALITTMYLRMFLSDLFLHGIGGGRYDELTDKLMTRFWGVQPPKFLVVSATLRLPSARLLVEPDDVRQIEGLIRQLWYHPELADPEPEVESQFLALCREKSRLLSATPAQGSRKAWHDELELTNGKLRALVKTKHQNLQREKARLLKQSRYDQHLASREYSFSILPESRQKKTLLDLVAAIA